jgi:hypothetical protein
MGRDESNEAGMFWWRWSLFAFRGVFVDGGAWLMTMLQLETPGSKTVPVQGNTVRGWKFAIRCLGSGAVESPVAFKRNLGLLLWSVVAFATGGMR